MDILKLGEVIIALYGFCAALVKFLPTLNKGWFLNVVRFLGRITNRQTDDNAIRAANTGGGGSVMPILILALGLSCAGCGLINFPTLNQPRPPDQVYNYRQTIDTKPTVLQTADGKAYVYTAQTQSIDAGYERKDKPLNFWQRICNWFANLGIIGIVITLVGLFFAPAATIAFLVRAKNRFQKALTQTVKAIDESGAVQEHAGLKEALSSKQDSDVKALIDDVQQPGK